MDPDDVVKPALKLLDNIYKSAEENIRHQVNVTTASGHPKYADVPDTLSTRCKTQEARTEFAQQLRDLEKRVVDILESRGPNVHQILVPAEPAIAAIPADPHEDHPLQRHAVRLWQMGFEEHMSIKGASSLASIMVILRGNIAGKGNQTDKFPLEVLFRLQGQQPGSLIDDFSVGISTGFGVTLACILGCMAAIDLGWLRPGVQASLEDEKLIARQLLRMLRLTCTYSPKPDMRSQVQESLGVKIQASTRARPTTIQMLFSPDTHLTVIRHTLYN